MRTFRSLAFVATSLAAAFTSSATADLKSEFRGGRAAIRADHFRLTVDAAQGGEITEIQLFDGSRWNRVLGSDGQTCPAVRLSNAGGDYWLANDAAAKMSKIQATRRRVRFGVTGSPKAADGRAGPWTVKLSYDIYDEGAVFVDLEYTLPRGEAELTAASLRFAVDEAIANAAHYNADKEMSRKYPGFRTARAAFGVNPARSYTNEVEAIVEYRKPLAETVAYHVQEFPYGDAHRFELRTPEGTRFIPEVAKGRFTWVLADRSAKIQGPFTYHNRFSLGLSAAATGKPRSNVIGQRIYTWVNFLDKENWFPTNEQIDAMAANGATMLILHKYWMSVPGSNGLPPASYKPRDEREMARTLARARKQGMRVQFYMRGCERYGLDFLKKHGKRDWDGIFMDWHGSLSVARHDQMYEPNPPEVDQHFSEDGNYLPAKEYFLFAKRCREVVGPKGTLIGHQMRCSTGVLGNLIFDAYLPGESHKDWEMFSKDVHAATYVGMCGGGVCTPWPIASPYRTPEAVAKMAVWGFYPHAILAYRTYSYLPDIQVLEANPDARVNQWVLPYWRLLSVIDVERASVYNLPTVNVVAATSSAPNVHSLVYRQDADVYLVLVGNLGAKTTQAELNLAPDVLGLKGVYQVLHVDSQTGALNPCGTCTNKITTTALPQWGIEGFKLQKAEIRNQ
jgi:hypothetical protein